MAKKNDDVIGLAKSGTATSKKPAARKPAAKKPTTRRKPTPKKEPELTPEQIRNQKAKERVTNLLQGVDLTLEKKEELLELDETPVAGDSENVEWLQEQITLLTQINEQLKSDLEAAKLGSPTAAVAGGSDEKVLTLFNELQENYLRMRGNFEVRFPAFLNRMIMFFPFLAQHKKY